MEKFPPFDYYKDSVKKIQCIYTYNGNVDETTSWEGYIVTQNVDGVLNIEGYEIDKMDLYEKNGSIHKRYILGKKAISYADESLLFEIYPGRIGAIHYNMRYNPEDGCFYGSWILIPSTNHSRPRDGKGEAIIRIEDVKVDEEEIIRIINQIANRYRSEYSEEIESHEYLVQNNLLSLINIDNTSTVKKLSRFSSSIRR